MAIRAPAPWGGAWAAGRARRLLPSPMAAPRPRILNLRLIVVAIALGVALAVVNVPVAAVVVHFEIRNGWARSINEDLIVDDHRVVTTLDRAACGTRWHRTSVPLNPGRRAFISYPQSPENARVFRTVPQNIWIDRDGHARGASLWLVGWPMRSAYGVRRTGPPLSSVQRVGMVEPVVFGRSWSLPWIPYPLGVLANSLFYALLALGVMALLRWMRVRRRRARDQCVACGYELGDGVDVCPECGPAAVRTPRERG